MNFMTNFFSGKKKLFAFLFLVVIALAIPLTVFVSQKQQTIKQRAAPLEQLSFTKSGETASLALSTENNGLTGFDITFSSDNPISPQSIILPSNIQNNFGQELINKQVSCDNGKFCYRIARIINLGGAPVPTDNGRLDIADFTNVKDQGDIKVVSAAVTSISGEVTLSSNPSLSYSTVNNPTTLPTNNASVTLTPAPTVLSPADSKLWSCTRYTYNNFDCSAAANKSEYLGCQTENFSQNQGCIGTETASQEITCFKDDACVSSAPPTPTTAPLPATSVSPSPTPDASQIYNQCYKICDQGLLISAAFDKPACILECDGKYKQLASVITTPAPTLSPVETTVVLPQPIAAKDEKPTVEVRASPDKADAGEEISLIVLGSDDLGLKSLERKTGDKTFLWFIKTGENWESFDCDNQKMCANTWKVTEEKKGKYSYCFKAIDSSNQTSESKCADVNIEPKEAGKNYPPVVKLEASPENPSVTDEISLKVTATDEGNGVKSISINLRDKDQTYQTYECPAKSKSCSKTWKVRESAEDTYSYIAFAVDNSGQKSKAAELDVLVKLLKGSVEEKKYKEELASGKSPCPQENFCVDTDECGRSNGKELTSYVCRNEPIGSSFQNKQISGSLPAVCCQIEKRGPTPTGLALIAMLEQIVIPSFDMEIKATEDHYAPPETKSVLGKIFGLFSYAYYASTALNLNMESWILKFRDEPKLREMDKQKKLYAYLKQELERGKTLDDVIINYSQYVDNNGELTKETKNKLDEKYNSFLKAFGEDCNNNTIPQNDCTPAAKVNSQKAIYVLKSFEEDIIKTLGKPRDPILVSLLRLEDRLNQGNANAEDNANLLFNIAELFDNWVATGTARFYYAKAVSLLEDNDQTGSPLYELASQRLKVLKLSVPREMMWDMTMMMASPDVALPFYPVAKLFVKPMGWLVKTHGFEAVVNALTKEIPVERKIAETYITLMSKFESAGRLAKEEIARLNGATKEIVSKMESMGLVGPEAQRGFIKLPGGSGEIGKVTGGLQKLKELSKIENPGKEIIDDIFKSFEDEGLLPSWGVSVQKSYLSSKPQLIKPFLEIITASENALRKNFNVLVLLNDGVSKEHVLEAFVKGNDMSDTAWRAIYDKLPSSAKFGMNPEVDKFVFLLKNRIYKGDPLPLIKALHARLKYDDWIDAFRGDISKLPEIVGDINRLKAAGWTERSFYNNDLLGSDSLAEFKKNVDEILKTRELPKIPSASQLQELLTKAEKGIATDEDRIALAFSLKETFKKDFGGVSEYEALLLQTIALKDNAKEIIEGFNNVLAAIPRAEISTRSNILQMLSDGAKSNTILDLYKNGKRASKKSIEELLKIYQANTTDMDRAYTFNGVMVNFGLYDNVNRMLEHAKLAFFNAPTTEMKYNWYKLVYKTLKDNGRDVEALRFFKDNKEFLFQERIKMADKAHPLLMIRFSDLSTPEAREELAWTLNKIFEPKEPLTANDLLGARIITKDEMTKEIEEIARVYGEQARPPDDILKYSIPLVLPTDEKGFASGEFIRKIGWPKYRTGLHIKKTVGGSLDGVPLWEDNGGMIFVMPAEHHAILHESTHVHWNMFRLVDKETRESYLLNELNSYFVAVEMGEIERGFVKSYSRATTLDDALKEYIDYVEATVNKELAQKIMKNEKLKNLIIEDLKKDESIITPEEFKRLEDGVAQAKITIRYLVKSDVSRIDIQHILLTSRSLDDFNKWKKIPPEKLKALLKTSTK